MISHRIYICLAFQWTALWATGAPGVSAPNLVEEDFRDEEETCSYNLIMVELSVPLISQRHATATTKTVQKVRQID